VTRRRRRAVVASAVAVAAAVAAAVLATRGFGEPPARYTLRPLVSDRGIAAAHHDRSLVNAWGLAALPTGPWWVANEASDTSTLYSASGRKQLLTVSVPGGPTGIAAYAGTGFPVRGGGHSDPARFIYACEDGRIRAWTPTVPTGWSTQAEIVVDHAGQAAIFRGVALTHDRVYATDFHNDRVDVFDRAWRQVRLPHPFVDASIPSWYAPAGIHAAGNRIFVTYVFRAPVNGNDAPSGGYVDEFDLDGRLVARVAGGSVLNEPWGLAVAPAAFGRHGGDLLVASFGSGHIDAFSRTATGWRHDGALAGRDGKPIVVNGVWGIAFGNGATAGSRTSLFAAGGPHRWLGASELRVHGLLAEIAPSS
jgi:uncharacterized protein (TIGR03118 family)